MTCIVALEDQGTVYMGADSAAIDGDMVSIRVTPKIFKMVIVIVLGMVKSLNTILNHRLSKKKML